MLSPEPKSHEALSQVSVQDFVQFDEQSLPALQVSVLLSPSHAQEAPSAHVQEPPLHAQSAPGQA